MSLAINVDHVAEVLLPDGQWYPVARREDSTSSFFLDSYEYISGAGQRRHDIHLAGGAEKLIPAIGAGWTDPAGVPHYCPLTAILAVRLLKR